MEGHTHSSFRSGRSQVKESGAIQHLDGGLAPVYEFPPSLAINAKVISTPTGCVVQVSIKEIGKNGSVGVAEAATFVPGLNIEIEKRDDNNIKNKKKLLSPHGW